jgi:hypothetical protein
MVEIRVPEILLLSLRSAAMQRITCSLFGLLLLSMPAFSAEPAADDQGWVRLFDGRTLDGWKVGANPGTFKFQDGMIVVNGPVAHLFYDGPVKNHDFKSFEFKADVMTFPKANSGIYIHTKFQEGGFPKIGYEVQINNSHSDPKRTGGLYNVQDVYKAPAKDNTWFNVHIIVRGKHIVVNVDGKKLVDYTEPDNVKGSRRLSSGTFALQGHDPGSKVCYKNIMVRPLED